MYVIDRPVGVIKDTGFLELVEHIYNKCDLTTLFQSGKVEQFA